MKDNSFPKLSGAAWGRSIRAQTARELASLRPQQPDMKAEMTKPLYNALATPDELRRIIDRLRDEIERLRVNLHKSEAGLLLAQFELQALTGRPPPATTATPHKGRMT